jgi:hypothetical protein
MRATLFLLGRVTYKFFADSWPSLTDEENLKRIKDAGGDIEPAKGFNPN